MMIGEMRYGGVAKWESVASNGDCTLSMVEGCLRSEDSAVSGAWLVIASNGRGVVEMARHSRSRWGEDERARGREGEGVRGREGLVGLCGVAMAHGQ
jgi:hypothetical protein